MDLGAQIVTRAGQPVEVTPQEFKVLRLFLTSSGRALSRDDILARCWGAEYEGTPRTVDNFVRSLRVKLERDPEAPRGKADVSLMAFVTAAPQVAPARNASSTLPPRSRMAT